MNDDGIEWMSNTKKGYMEAHEGDGLVMDRPWVARGTVQEQICPTIVCTTGGGCGTVVRMTEDMKPGYRIRYLTPRECFRLMGQRDDAIDKIMATGTSNSKLYAMAGNSIVVDVLADIFKGIYMDETFKRENPTLEDYL